MQPRERYIFRPGPFSGKQTGFLWNKRVKKSEEAKIISGLAGVGNLIRNIGAKTDFLTSEQIKSLKWLYKEFSVYQILAKEVVSIHSSEMWNVARVLMAQETVPLARRVTETLKLLSVEYSNAMKKEAKNTRTMSKRVLSFLAVLIGMMTVSAVIMARHSSLTITRPLVLFSSAALEFYHGHLTEDIKVTGDDDLEYLANSFNTMRSSLMEKEKK